MTDAAKSGSSKVREISLGDDFGVVAVNVNSDCIIKVNDDCIIEVRKDGDWIRVYPAANEDGKSKAALKVGDLDDGGIYVGLSAENGRPLHAALKDLPDKTYKEALEAAEQLKSLHPTAHVPTPAELNENLYKNRNASKELRESFNTSGSFPASVYRSSAPDDYGLARVQYFDDGYQDGHYRNSRLPVRLVW